MGQKNTVTMHDETPEFHIFSQLLKDQKTFKELETFQLIFLFDFPFPHLWFS